MSHLTWEEKLHACQALSECAIRMRKPGDWYVDTYVEVRDGPILHGIYGNGGGPIAAIENHWDCMTNLQPGQYLVAHAGRDNRRAVRWNGFMWAAVDEEKERV